MEQEFVYDDEVAVVKNPDVRLINRTAWQTLMAISQNDFWGQHLENENSHKSYRPIPIFIHHMEYRYLHNENMAAFMKRTNFIIHILLCSLLYDVLRRVLGQNEEKIISNAVLLFAVHPIHAEVILTGVGRADLSSAIFFIVTTDFYVNLTKSMNIFKTKFYDDFSSFF